MPRIRTDDAHAALRSILQERASEAANGNTIISKAEAKNLDPVLKQAEEQVRAAEGKGSRVTVDEAVNQAADNARAVWNEFSPEGTQDGLWLSKAELDQIADKDPALGELSKLAYLRAGQPPPDVKGAVRGFFDSFDFAGLRTSLPSGKTIDAREGQAGRAELPASVLVGFDHYARAMDADWATVTAHQAKIDGHDVNVVYMTTDGDDAYLEVTDKDGNGLASAKLMGGELLAWDPFFGRARLSKPLQNLDNFKWDEGYSEPAEAAAAGQLPLDGSWTPDLVVDSGRIVKAGKVFVGLEGGPAMSLEHAQAAYAAFEHVNDAVFQHQDWDIKLPGAGRLRLGTFTRPDDGKTYVVADWKDVDDASFTYYFEKTDAGLKLAINQYNG